MQNKRLHVMGEVNKRFVVSPDLDTLLHAMELRDQAEANAMPVDDPSLIKME
jgi:DNA-directed RNA polymerase III subunit RPC4